MLTAICQMWAEHGRLDEAAANLRRLGKVKDGEAHAIAAETMTKRILALEALALAAAHVTLGDALAQLILLHDDIHGRCAWHDDLDVRAVPRMLSDVVPALAVIGRHAGFDFAVLDGNYLTSDEAMLAGGEVPA
ncbi:hypothetical protein IBL26_11845 [Roseomonas aerophila]|uniref:Uncharacterized protein n=1 Tax=Teichococcus aerophilus TaxID=1224513 RepID=A0ABR7RM77_9PROT|nr:hypothetical protein [Pseudoroseomonas aerophila]MBC9207528.1 hypothetical protein [Pseudoroseomonas aerophila]